jgi:DNA-directed RNA polymerase specialized sigma24 family protein
VSIMVTFRSHAYVRTQADAKHRLGSVGGGWLLAERVHLSVSAPGLPRSDDESVIAVSQPDQAGSLPPQPAADSSAAFLLAREIQPLSSLGAMAQPSQQSVVELRILPNLDAAYSLAYWLTLDPVDAEDIVEDVCVRTLSCFASFRGDDEKVLLLQMVRNRVYAKRETVEAALGRPGEKNDNNGGVKVANFVPSVSPATAIGPDPLLAAVRGLPIDLRECLVLREMEGLQYNEIARITEVSPATVMARLYRARQILTAPDLEPSPSSHSRPFPHISSV